MGHARSWMLMHDVHPSHHTRNRRLRKAASRGREFLKRPRGSLYLLLAESHEFLQHSALGFRPRCLIVVVVAVVVVDVVVVGGRRAISGGRAILDNIGHRAVSDDIGRARAKADGARYTADSGWNDACYHAR